MDKQNVVHIYYETVFSFKRERNSDTCCNMAEPWGVCSCQGVRGGGKVNYYLMGTEFLQDDFWGWMLIMVAQQYEFI